jgi:putative MFS transporter
MENVQAEPKTITIRTPHDVYAFVNAQKDGAPALRWLLLATLGSFFIDGHDLTGFGIAVPTAARFFHLGPVQIGALSSTVALGAMIAAIAGGYFVDKIGRLRMFILDLFCFVVAAIVGALTDSYAVLLACRFAMGIGIGLDVPAAYSFIVEYTALNQKRRTANRYLVFLYYAQLFSYGSAILFFLAGAGPNLWRWVVGIGALPALILVVVRYLYMQESPFWLASRGDLEGAAQILERMYGVKVTVESSARSASPTLARYLNYGSLFTREYLARTISAGAINVLQSIEFFAIGFYVPVIAGILFRHSPYVVVLLGAAIFSVIGLIGSSLSAYTVENLGIRRQTLIGYLVQMLALLAIGLVGQGIPALLAEALIGVFFLSHTFGPGQNGVTMSALSYPTEIRGAGTGFSYGIGRAGSFIGTFFFPLLLSHGGLVHALLWTAVVPLVGLLVLLGIRWDPTGAEVDVAPAAGQSL